MRGEPKKPTAEEERMRNLEKEKFLPESPEDLPFGGLPYSYEGRFMALFQDEQADNAGEEKGMAGQIACLSSNFSSLARCKVVPFVVVLAVVLLVSPFLLKALIEGRWNQRTAIHMTKYLAPVKEGFVEVPLQLVEERKLVSFSYSRDGEAVPLLAYVTPAGKFGAAVGFSRPCQSEKFHLEGDDIVCDLCLTRWDLETLKGMRGDCLDHPLDKIMYTIRDGKLMIREAGIQGWNRG